MHYTNRQLEAELQKIAEEENGQIRTEASLPVALPLDAYEPLPEVEDFVREYRDYQLQTEQLDVGDY
jgi:hypothetical protein